MEMRPLRGTAGRQEDDVDVDDYVGHASHGTGFRRTEASGGPYIRSRGSPFHLAQAGLDGEEEGFACKCGGTKRRHPDLLGMH